MLIRFIFAITLLSSADNWALSCSDPITISDPRIDACCARIFSNEKEDVVLTWLSQQGNNEMMNVSHKTENSSWLSPETLSQWENDLYQNYCFVNSEGDLFATWETEKGDEFVTHVAEKKQGKPWEVNLNWISKKDNLWTSDIGFDASGNLIFIGHKEIPYKPKATSKFRYKTEVNAIALLTKSPTQVDRIIETLPLEEDVYSVSDIKIILDKNGAGYAIWVSHTLDGKRVMCQKIQNAHFISEPESICKLENYIYELEATLNERGDIALVYLDNQYNGNILTKIKDCWSKPFPFTTKEENPTDLQIAIDSSGNTMAACAMGINEGSIIKTMYKPFGRDWAPPILFSNPNEANWNPQIKPDGNENFVLIWQKEKRNRNAIFGSSFSTTTQSWSDPQRLSSQGESCFGYTYTFSAPGKGYIAWTMSPNGFDQVVQVAELCN